MLQYMSIDLLLVCFQALYCGLVLFLFSELLFWEHGIECRYAVCPFFMFQQGKESYL